MSWSLVNAATGTTVKSGFCDDPQITYLSAGSYVLSVKPQAERTGPYSFKLFEVPAPQAFDVTLPLGVSDGVPGPGAGNLETKASEDRYLVEVAAGQSLYLDWLTCPSGEFVSWSLVNAATGATVKSGFCSDVQITNLSAGSYVLSVKPRDERTGTYSLNIA